MIITGGVDGEVDQYYSEYFSVAKFMATYANNVPALLGKDQWNIVDPGFKLHSLVMTRPPGRLKKNRLRTGEEGRLPKRRACENVEFWGILLGFVPISGGIIWRGRKMENSQCRGECNSNGD